jgi:3-dehydroquinate synthase
MITTVTVALGAQPYDIHIGERLLARAGELIEPLLGNNRQVITISDRQVARFYLHRLSNALEERNIRQRVLLVDPGEGSKSLESFGALVEQLLELKPDRHTLVLALGGGVVGDLAGFAASVALRGLRFVQIPTTLLAQVDSAVGGKTAINSRYGKNLIGSFHQPSLVLADLSALSSLPERHRKAGYAEILKYGLIESPAFFEWLEQHGARVLAGEVDALAYGVAESCRRKAAIVAADERESGVRALLNFGHTFAHALEAETGYGEALLHGEAVAIGMVLALKCSVRMGLCPPSALARVQAHYAALGLPSQLPFHAPGWHIDALMEHFSRDKKASNGALTFILARDIGQAFVARDVPPAHVREVLAEAVQTV